MAGCPTTLLYFNEWEALSHREKKVKGASITCIGFLYLS